MLLRSMLASFARKEMHQSATMVTTACTHSITAWLHIQLHAFGLHFQVPALALMSRRVSDVLLRNILASFARE